MSNEAVNITDQWRKDWSSTSLVNHTTVTDLTTWQPGFHLSRQTWSLLNHFWTVRGLCHATRTNGVLPHHRRAIVAISEPRTTLMTCPLTESKGGLLLLHEAE